MAPNQRFRNYLSDNIRLFISRSTDIADLENASLIGRIRELLLNHLLEPVLPPYVQTGKGILVDVDGKESTETDLILYNQSILPPILYSEKDGFFPIEACYYAIEIKSTLSATNLRDSIEKARKMMLLRHSLDYIAEGLKMNTGAFNDVRRTIFALGSDLSLDGKTELARYRELDEQADSHPAFRVICVLGKGYWWFSQNQEHSGGGMWYYHDATKDHDEIIDFIGGICNTIPTAKQRIPPPAFGNYIIQNNRGQ